MNAAHERKRLKALAHLMLCLLRQGVERRTNLRCSLSHAYSEAKRLTLDDVF